MLNSVKSLQTGRIGIVDDVTDKLIAPLIYDNVVFQKYGISAERPDGFSDAYSLAGTPLLKNGKNMLFLNNNLIITSTPSNYCCIVNYSTQKAVLKLNVDAILFFYGSKQQAEIYTPDTILTDYFSNPDYIEFGAHVEDLVCCRLKTSRKWGVFNIKDNRIIEGFSHDAIVQIIDSQIVVRGTDGNPKWLF